MPTIQETVSEARNRSGRSAFFFFACENTVYYAVAAWTRGDTSKSQTGFDFRTFRYHASAVVIHVSSIFDYAQNLGFLGFAFFKVSFHAVSSFSAACPFSFAQTAMPN